MKRLELSLEELQQEMARVNRLSKEVADKALFINQNPTYVTVPEAIGDLKLAVFEIGAMLENLESKVVRS